VWQAQATQAQPQNSTGLAGWGNETQGSAGWGAPQGAAVQATSAQPFANPQNLAQRYYNTAVQSGYTGSYDDWNTSYDANQMNARTFRNSQSSPTMAAGLEGVWSAQGRDPQDMWGAIQRGLPKSQASTYARWK
jgi:hypothetical protein